MHLAPGAVKACGWRSPTQSPKHLCCTLGGALLTRFAAEMLLFHEYEEAVVREDLKVNWSARGGETAGEVEGGGGEERGELLWVA